MNQKKARASRIARKAASVEKSEVEREYNAALGKLRRERQDAFVAADAEFGRALKGLEQTRNAAREAAREAYDKAYAKLVKQLAAKERAAA